MVEDNFLLIADYYNGIFQLDLETESVHRLEIDTYYALAVDYDHTTGRVYWSDIYTNTINSALLDGSDSEVVVQTNSDGKTIQLLITISIKCVYV